MTDVSTMSQSEVAAMFTSEFSDFKSSAARQRLMLLPEIRLSVPMTKKNVDNGNWFLVDSNVPKGEPAKIEVLGRTFKFTVIRDAMRLAAYDEKENNYILETTEFQDYTRDPVMLFDRRSGRLKVSAFCTYSGPQAQTISKLRAAITPTLPPKCGFGFEYLVYIILEDGRLACLRNTARGHLGTNVDGEVLDFDTVSDDSFLHARSICHALTPGITCAQQWEAYSVLVKAGEREPRPAFRILGFIEKTEIQRVKERGHWLQQYLNAKYADRLSYAWRNMDYNEKRGIASSYQNVRELLDETGGDIEVAAMLLGKRTVRNRELIEAGPPEDTAALRAEEEKNKAEVAKKIEELQSEQGLPETEPGAMHVPFESMYQSDIKPEDLPF